MSRAYYWASPQDLTLVSQVERELAPRGVSLQPFEPAGEPSDGVLFVFLTARFLGDNPGWLDAVISAWRRSVVPVYLEPELDPLPSSLAERTRIYAPGRTAGWLAAAIAAATRAEPQWRAEWQGVVAAATRWSAASSEKAELPSRSEVDRAAELMRGGHRAEVEPVRPVVERFLDAGLRVARRRSRKRAGIILGLSVLLVVAATVALIQRAAALDARDAAHSAAAKSQAERLARLARQSIGSDPDLPSVLARRAYELDPSPAMRVVLRRAVDAAPWHRSYRLPDIPFGLVGSSRSPLVVLAAESGRLSLIDSRDGKLVTSAAEPIKRSNVPVLAVSPDGTSVAVAYDGGLVQVRALDRSFRVTRSIRLGQAAEARSLSIAWLGRGELLSAWSGLQALRVDLSRGRASTAAVEGAGPAFAVGAAADGSLAVLVARRRVAILKAGGGDPCAGFSTRRSVPGGTVAVDLVNRTVAFAGQGQLVFQLPIPARCAAPGGQRPELSSWPAASGSQAAIALPEGGVMVGTALGEVVHLIPPALYPADVFLAHGGSVTGVAIASGGRLVTSGTDRWLRVWQTTPPAPVYPTGPAYNVALGESYSFDLTRATWRSMLAVDETDEEVVTGGFTSGHLAVAERGRLARPRVSSWLYPNTSIRPAPTSPCSALAIDSGGEVRVVRCEHEEPAVVWTRPGNIDRAWVINSAISDDGRAVALWNGSDVELTQVPGGRVYGAELGGVVAGAFDPERRFVAVDERGTVSVIDSSEETRRVAVDVGAHPVAAMAVTPAGREVLLVTADGQMVLADTANGRVRSRLVVDSIPAEPIDAEVSRDGRLAAVVGSAGFAVVDLRRGQTIAARSISEDEGVGAEPRDAAFLDGGRSLLVMRADEGLVEYPLERWRFLDGEALLSATAGAVPRRLAAGEFRGVLATAEAE